MKKIVPITLKIFFSLIIFETLSRSYIKIQVGDLSKLFEKWCEKYSYQSDPSLGFEIKENLVIDSHSRFHTNFSTNSLGFRGSKEFSQKREKEIRVALLGGSCVFGYGASSDQTSLGPQLNRALSAAFPENKFSVINSGHPTYVSWQVIERFKRKVLPLEPDIIIFYAGWNDLFLHSNYPFVDPTRYFGRHLKSIQTLQGYIEHENRPLAPPLRYLAMSLFTKSFLERIKPQKSWLDKSEKFGKNADYIAIFKQYRNNIGELAKICKNNQIQLILVTLFSEYDVFREDREKINDVIKKASQEFSSQIVDLDAIVTRKKIKNINNTLDRYHMTDKGNKFIADALSRKIKKDLSF